MLDKLIIGAGLYGLYSALYCAGRGQRVAVLEMDSAPFSRATYINQARVHMGYHYPRSLSTALKSAGYFRRFVEDYSFCIHSGFQQVYATSRHFSWTDAKEFLKFCRDAGIPCEPLPVDRYFQEGSCDGAFLTQEYTYDAHILRDFFLEELSRHRNVELFFDRKIDRIVKGSDRYEVYAMHEGREERYEAPFVLNATYASVNQVLNRIEGIGEPGGGVAEADLFRIKYELCEIILCRVSENLRNIGLTVMDGPFFSIMPFGKTGYHSLTSVTFTPHKTSRQKTPQFPCMGESGAGADSESAALAGADSESATFAGGDPEGRCGERLGNCNTCANRPESAWEYMSALARKYVKEEYRFEYEKSLFSMKPILKASEIDDSRPTVIKYATRKPTFLSVLSGKINTVYDLDEFLEKG